MANTVQGSITHNGGNSELGDGLGAIDFDGQAKTIDAIVGGEGNQLQILSKIVNGRINKVGPGTLVLSHPANAFTGQNVVSDGTLVGTVDSIGADVLNNAAVELTSGTLATAKISGAGVVRVGNVTFAVAQSHTGGTEVLGQAVGDAGTLDGNFSSTTGGELVFSQNSDGIFTGNLAGNLKLIKQGGGVLSVGGASTSTNVVALQEGGLNFLTDSAVGLVINTPNVVTLEATGTRTFATAPQFLTQTTFVGAGNLKFTDGSTKTQNAPLVHNSSGTTEINGKFVLSPTASITVNAGAFVLGDPLQIGGFAAAGPIVLNGGTLTARSQNFTSLSAVTVAGGTLNVPGGYAIPLSSALQGHGGVTGRIASANGSSIIADGSLVLGDAAHPSGINLDGELYTGAHAVTLNDANQAALGSLTDLGTASQDGTLAAPHGVGLAFTRNLVGRGQIQSNNAAADATIINGAVNGDSAANPLEFTGYVKGTGTFNNVAFSGTFAPGLSPTLSTVGNVILRPTNVLDMELAGLSRGSPYDAIDATGLLQLGGTLQVSLLGAFRPSLGDQFDLFNGSLSGAFAGFNLPALGPGLNWDASGLYTTGVLGVIATAPIDADFDGDHDVDGDDLAAWTTGFGAEGTATNQQGDADGDQDVDGVDFMAWQRGDVPAAAAIPEPAAWLLAAVGVVLLQTWRRRAVR